MKNLFAIALVGAAIYSLVGCGSTSAKDARSAAINASGDASIENWVSPVLKTTRLFTLRIDGELLQSKGKRGVYALSPGKHRLEVHCQFSRLLPQLIIDAGMAVVELDAKAGTRYRLQTEKVGALAADVWIVNVATGELAVPRTRVELIANPQEVPLFIPIVST